MKNRKKIVKQSFKKWRSGTSSFFDLLADDVRWTITGKSPIAGTYQGREQFLREAIDPLNQRFSKPIVPSVRKLYSDGKTVIALWDGSAVAKDGKPYVNTYSWYMKFRKDKIVEVVAFFDSIELAEIWERVPAQ